jgi:hypothetical protein
LRRGFPEAFDQKNANKKSNILHTIHRSVLLFKDKFFHIIRVYIHKQRKGMVKEVEHEIQETAEGQKIVVIPVCCHNCNTDKHVPQFYESPISGEIVCDKCYMEDLKKRNDVYKLHVGLGL